MVDRDLVHVEPDSEGGSEAVIVGMRMRTMSLFSTLGAVFLIALTGASVQGAPLPGAPLPGASLQGAKERREMLISTEQLARQMKSVRVLHVARDKAHYDAGHIPGAVFLPLSDITATRDGVPVELAPLDKLVASFTKAGIGDRSKVVVYGELQGLLAARAYITLEYLGHGSRVSLLDGGLEKWKQEGRPVSTETTMESGAPFTPRLQPSFLAPYEFVADASWAVRKLNGASVVLVDARSPEEFSGEKPGDGVPRGGHIPGAVSLFWQKHVASLENPVMKRAADLRSMYAGVGVVPGKRPLVYCRTGTQASQTYFILKYLGYDPILYDGSFTDWSNRKDAEVATGKG